MSECQQSVNDLQQANGQIAKANKTLIDFYDTDKHKLIKLF